MKSFAGKLNNKIFIHGSSVLFLFATAYTIFFGEFIDGTFLHYYFEKIQESYFFSEHSHQICNFPFIFWGFWFCLSSFLFVIKFIKNEKLKLSEAVLSGLITHFF